MDLLLPYDIIHNFCLKIWNMASGAVEMKEKKKHQQINSFGRCNLLWLHSVGNNNERMKVMKKCDTKN